MEEDIIYMPLFLVLAKYKTDGKKYYLNFNHYHNWDFHVRNNLKKKYQAHVMMLLPRKEYYAVDLTFTLFPGDNRKRDRFNVLSIHDKFFCDALSNSGRIQDDNDDFIVESHYRSGPIDRENPRVEIKIKDMGFNLG